MNYCTNIQHLQFEDNTKINLIIQNSDIFTLREIEEMMTLIRKQHCICCNNKLKKLIEIFKEKSKI